MRALLTLWVAVALWLVPATAERAVPVGGMHVAALQDAPALDAARVPERVATTLRGAPPAPVRGGGTPPCAWPARDDTTWAGTSRVPGLTLPTTARRGTPPRRLSFPVEANAPPGRLS